MSNEWIEISAKTVDDAINEGLVRLGTTTDKMEVEVLEKESAGFLGFIGRHDAKIRVRIKEVKEVKPASKPHKKEIRNEKPVVVKEQINLKMIVLESLRKNLMKMKRVSLFLPKDRKRLSLMQLNSLQMYLRL